MSDKEVEVCFTTNLPSKQAHRAILEERPDELERVEDAIHDLVRYAREEFATVPEDCLCAVSIGEDGRTLSRVVSPNCPIHDAVPEEGDA